MGKEKPRPTTIYLNPKLARAVKVKAALAERSFSDIVSEALTRTLSEDELDLRAFEERKHEPDRAFEQVLKDLKRDGLL